MKTKLWLCVLALFFVAADGAKEKETKKYLKKLQGSWAFVAIEEEVVKKSARELKDLEDRLNWTFTGNELLRNLGNEPVKGKFRIDASKQPKEIDFFDYAQKGKVVRGIYTFEGQQLKICVGNVKTGER